MVNDPIPFEKILRLVDSGLKEALEAGPGEPLRIAAESVTG